MKTLIGIICFFPQHLWGHYLLSPGEIHTKAYTIQCTLQSSDSRPETKPQTSLSQAFFMNEHKYLLKSEPR